MTESELSRYGPEQTITAADATEMRRLSHDLNNALEIIVQASYLVNMTELSDPAKDWMKLLDQGLRQAAELNKELRNYILSHS
ncbi:MAG: hypothetical protein ACR2JE_03950 [Acidobacteriaceae bacterium]